MNNKEAGKIGIFEYDWSMYSFIKEFAIKLAEEGYVVDIFYKNPKSNVKFADSEQLQNYANINFFAFKPSNTVIQKIARKFRGLLRRLSWNYTQNPKNIIEPEIMLRSQKLINESNYLCFIGIEKKGLIWAGTLSQIFKCPLIYYSLELYDDDHPEIKKFSYLRKAEKKYHQLSRATIIQDKLRAKALIQYNEIKNTDLLYLPISIRGDIVENKSRFFYHKFKIKETKKLLLYYGLIQAERFSTDLVGIANRLPDDIVLVLHGYGEQTYLANLQSLADKDRVVFSLDFVEEEEISDLISSATIGLALYANTNSNDRLAAFSSVKVAYYLQCGDPIIAFDSESFRELMNTYKCGELINSIDEIPQKAEKILTDYDSYREQAFMAFRKLYNFDENFRKFKLDFDDFIKKTSSETEISERIDIISRAIHK